MSWALQAEKNGAIEIEVNDVTKEGCEKASSDQFDLLRVLGQGSFGKVSQSSSNFVCLVKRCLGLALRPMNNIA